MYTAEQQANNRRLWVEGLRSGNYQQIYGNLRNATGFCALGVGVEVLNLWSLTYIDHEDWLYIDHEDWSGFNESQLTHIMQLNDYRFRTFDQIADLIEEWSARIEAAETATTTDVVTEAAEIVAAMMIADSPKVVETRELVMV